MDQEMSIRDRLFEQFSNMVVADGWSDLSLSSIARAADVDVSVAYGEYRNRYAYVTELVRRIDLAMLAECDEEIGGEPPRERLFDVIMARFEAMQEHRALILKLHYAMRKDPSLAMHLLALSRLTGEWFLDMAHISPSGLKGIVRGKGAMLVYARAFAAWLKDDSEDLSKTMAALDKTLKSGEKGLKQASKLASFAKRARAKCRKPSSKCKRPSGKADADGPSVDEGMTAPMPS